MQRLSRTDYLEQFKFPVEVRRADVPSKRSADYRGIIDPENPQTHIPNDWQSIVRADTDELIAILPKTYTIVTNEEVINAALDELSRADYIYRVNQNYSFFQNNRMRLQIDFPEITINDGESDLDLSFYIHNSYDMSEGVRGMFGFIRLVCSNGMVVGEMLEKFYHRHTSGFNLHGLKQVVENVIDKIPEVRDQIRYLDSIRTDEQIVKKVNKGATKKMKEAVGTIDASGDMVVPSISQWELYNRLTYFISHSVALHMQSRHQQAISKHFSL